MTVQELKDLLSHIDSTLEVYVETKTHVLKAKNIEIVDVETPQSSKIVLCILT